MKIVAPTAAITMNTCRWSIKAISMRKLIKSRLASFSAIVGSASGDGVVSPVFFLKIIGPKRIKEVRLANADSPPRYRKVSSPVILATPQPIEPNIKKWTILSQIISSFPPNSDSYGIKP